MNIETYQVMRAVLLRCIRQTRYDVPWDRAGTDWERRRVAERRILRNELVELRRRGRAQQCKVLRSCIIDALKAFEVHTATGAALDALARIPKRPTWMTDADVRKLMTDGFVVSESPVTARDASQRSSPQLTVFVTDIRPTPAETEAAHAYFRDTHPMLTDTETAELFAAMQLRDI